MDFGKNVSFDPEKRSCVVMRMSHDRFQFSEMAGNTLYEGVTITKLEWRFDVKKIGFTHLYCEAACKSPHACATGLTILTACGRRSPELH